MGLLDIFKPQPSAPTLISILPEAAKQEILCGRLPILKTDKVFLKSNEQCHYIDKAVYEKKVFKKSYVHNKAGYSMPGPLKNTRINFGGGKTDSVEKINYETIRGILYITNKRLIFVGESTGFNKEVDELIAITPFSNCIELQFSNDDYKIFVPDGNVVHTVLKNIND